ncbi:MAG: GAF domain-containing protein [Nitrospirae bacterium]|nr:GAF domain-containing protein [Nitrospirota bacterium]
MALKRAAKIRKGIAASDKNSKRKRMLNALVKKNRLLTTINNIAIAIGRPLHFEELLNTAQEEILKLLNLKKSIIYLVNNNKLWALTYRGLSEEFVRQVKTINIGEGPAGKAVNSRKIVIIEDIYSTPCEIINRTKINGVKGCIFIPLKSKERVMGVLALCLEKPSPLIKEINLLESISNHLGTLIENTLLFKEKEQAYEDIKAIQDRLVQMETLTAIGKLTAGLAHEIATPLNIISGRAEYLLSELGETDIRSENLKVIISQIERITDLVKRLLTLASGEKAKVEDISINHVIRDILSFMERKIINSGINIETFLADNLPFVKINQHRLQQVFINIISNSLDATQRGGKISLRTYLIREDAKPDIIPSQHCSFICIEISDTGCGIEEKYLNKIFDPFFTTKKSGEGTGLGLAITKNIIEEYGGDIEVKSAVGKGATFIIRLPAKE